MFPACARPADVKKKVRKSHYTEKTKNGINKRIPPPKKCVLHHLHYFFISEKYDALNGVIIERKKRGRKIQKEKELIRLLTDVADFFPSSLLTHKSGVPWLLPQEVI